MRKKIAIIFLAVLLAFSNFATVSAAEKTLPQNAKKKDKAKTTEIKETEDPDKEVRVIVEMDDEAPVEKATKKGIMFNKMPEKEKKNLNKAAKAKQKAVKDEMKQKKVKAKYLQEFTTVVNGFSAEVKQGDLELIRELPDVKTVSIVTEYEQPKVKPEMKYSKELVEAQKAWRDYGYKGEGMVVGIIDTGIDYTHQDMILSDGIEGDLSKKFVEDTISEEDLPGKFYTEKVPYGYNYMDENDEVREIHSGASYHGMHVGGTVAANGDEDNGGILGIAPEAQLLALKVFGNDPELQTTYGDIYIKAIDDSIKLGADVLNMSLGSPSGYVNADAPEQRAVSRAVDNGILMSISAGNSALFGDGFFYPYASNPDYGVSGSPGVANDSTQVASFENTYMDVDALQYSIDGEAGRAAFFSAGNTLPSTDGEQIEVLTAGLGHPGDFEGKDFTGKYALIQRGELAFTEKAINAQNAGAVGVIVYNNTDGIVNMASDPSITIPYLFMLKSDGDRLAEAAQNGQAVTIAFNGEKTQMENTDAGKMSAFSSWGLTPNLDFKPEITAPGGQILSTLNDGQYGLMSGTSMAAPHVSGGSALVLQRVDEEFGYGNANRVNHAKNLMLNTSTPVDFDGAPVSPRRQGAGLMQIHAALSTPVVVTESASNEAKVALKEINSNEVTFELTAENYSDEAVTYDVSANAQTDTPVNGGSAIVTAPNMFGGNDLGDIATVNGEPLSTIEVPANGQTSLEVSIDLSGVDASLAEIFTNGYWVEGFVTFTDPTDMNPELTVPYVGFKGAWDDAPIFDTPLWDASSFYGMTGIATDTGGGSYGFLGENLETGEFDPEKIAFSPNGNGVQDNALLILSFLRNAKEAKFNVLDEDKKVVRTIRLESDLRKNYYDGGRAPEYSLSANRAWDGKINNKLAEDGQYYLQVEAVIDYQDAEKQTLDLPVILDTTAPEVDATIDQDGEVLTVAVDDGEGSGLATWDVLVDGESVLETPYTESVTEHELTDFDAESTVTVVATDYAGNEQEEEAVVEEPADTTVPDLHLLTPELLEAYDSREVLFSGYVTDESGVKEVTVDGQQAELVYNEEEDRYDFSLTLSHKKDDFYFRHIKAVDNAGNETEIGRRYFVDTEAATIKVKAPKKTKEDSVTVSATIKDNFDDINLYVNGNHVFTHDISSPYGKKRFKETIEDIELNLEDGENVFEFKVVDLAGHETVEEVVITKQAKKEKEKDKGKDKDKEKYDFVGYIFERVFSFIGKLWSIFG
ncbi:S8 family serine peptidase [Oceanobacillus manasiensis]|uniref:S8 family serine peptidase n=1 Tax=Oceanobacillus manasiensis TaxID=586413 RepID=UPI0005A7E3C3|nr:S8 family serine peptidase [Oceanobacillus manasiensis]